MAAGEPTVSRLRMALLGALLIVDFLVVVVMLVTDTNLQTDFGGPKYFAHWYGLLAQGILTLLVALAVLWAAAGARSGRRGARVVALGATGFAFLVFLADVAIVFSYAMVGYATLGQFANYLYGITPTPGDIRFLYDGLLAVYLLTGLVGVFAARRVAAPVPAPAPAS